MGRGANSRLAEVARASVEGGFFLSVGTTLSLVILGVGSIVIARLLGSSGYGLYRLSLTIPTLMTFLVIFGIDTALMNFTARLRAEGKPGLAVRFVRAGLALRVMAGALASLACLALSDLIATWVLSRPGLGPLIRVASLAILFQAMMMSSNAALVGLDRADRNAIVRNVEAVGKTGASILLVLVGLSALGPVLGHLIGSVMAGLTALVFVLAEAHRLKKLAEAQAGPAAQDEGPGLRHVLASMVGYGWPVYVSSLLLMAVGQYQLILLSSFVSDAEIGNYSAASNFLLLMNTVSTSMTIALLPAFSKLDSSSSLREIRCFFRLAVKYSSMLVVPASVLMASLSDELIYVVYGPGYDVASLFLALLMLIPLTAGLGSLVITSFFNGVGETKTTMKVFLVNTLIFLPLSLLLTRAYGTVGMIVASAASSLVSALYGLSAAWRGFGAKPDLSCSAKVYMASALSALPVLVLKSWLQAPALITLVACGLVYLLAYTVLSPLLGVIDGPDLDNLSAVLGGLGPLGLPLRLIIEFERKLLLWKS